jgi:hypothetical protein
MNNGIGASSLPESNFSSHPIPFHEWEGLNHHCDENELQETIFQDALHIP